MLEQTGSTHVTAYYCIGLLQVCNNQIHFQHIAKGIFPRHWLFHSDPWLVGGVPCTGHILHAKISLQPPYLSQPSKYY